MTPYSALGISRRVGIFTYNKNLEFIITDPQIHTQQLLEAWVTTKGGLHSMRLKYLPRVSEPLKPPVTCYCPVMNVDDSTCHVTYFEYIEVV